MLSGPDWLYWSTGWSLAGIGFLVLLWALLFDRAKGRRRCPRCWYDMHGTDSMTCSECGFTGRRERKFSRTRRRWRVAAFAMLLSLIGLSGVCTPKVKRDGWRSLVPNVVLIAAMPDHLHKESAWYAELDRRLWSRCVSRWQWKWLISRCVEADDVFSSFIVRTRRHWPVNEPLRARVYVERTQTGYEWFDKRDIEVTVHSSLGASETSGRKFSSGSSQYLFDGESRLPWFERTFQAGQLSEGGEIVHFYIQARVKCLTPDVSEYVKVASQTHAIAVTVGGTIEDQIKGESEANWEQLLAEVIEFRANSYGFWFSVPNERLITELPELSLGLEVVLLNGDDTWAVGHVWQGVRDVQRWKSRFFSKDANPERSVGMFGGVWEPTNSTLITETESGHGWRVLCRSSPRMALRDFESDRHWQGEMNRSLTWDPVNRMWHAMMNESSKP